MGGLIRRLLSCALLLSAILLVIASSSNAEDLIIRSTQECCKQSPDFAKGSEAFLIDSTKVIGDCMIKKEGPFTFTDVKPGYYDLVVSVEGYYPIKFTHIEIGEGGVFDFELIADLKPLTTNLLEGWLTLQFKRRVSDEEIIKRLKKWHLDPRQTSRTEAGSEKPEFRIQRLYNSSEVRVSYDKKKNLSDIMADILVDPDVIECTPAYF